MTLHIIVEEDNFNSVSIEKEFVFDSHTFSLDGHVTNPKSSLGRIIICFFFIHLF
jgi:hypothetical protein